MFPFRSTKASVANLLGWWEQHFQKLPSNTYPCSQSLIEIPCAIYLILKKMLKKFKTMLENTLISPHHAGIPYKNKKKASNIVAAFQSQTKKLWCEGVDYFWTTVHSSKIFRHGSYFVLTFILIKMCLKSGFWFYHTLLGHANKTCNILTTFSWWFLYLSAACSYKKYFVVLTLVLLWKPAKYSLR